MGKADGESTVRLTVGTLCWQVLRSHRELLEKEIDPLLTSEHPDPRCIVVKQNRLRTVLRLELTGGPNVYVKQFRARRWDKKLLRSIAFSQGRNEWRRLRKARRNIPSLLIPRPIAVVAVRAKGLLRESWLVLEEIPDAATLKDVLVQETVSTDKREDLLHKLGHVVLQMAEGGLFHRDFGAANVFVSSQHGRDRLAVMDLHRATVTRRCSEERFVRMAARMCSSLEHRGANEDERLIFLRAAMSSHARMESIVEKVHRRVQEVERRKRERRARRRKKRNSSQQ